MGAIRLAREADAPAVRAIYAPLVEGTLISFEVEPPDEEEVRRRIVETLRARPWLVAEVDGAVAGFAYASGHRSRAAYAWSVEASVYVHEAHRRRGVGHGLYASLMAALRLQGYVNAYAGIALPNPASVAFHEAFGFEPVGVYRGVGYKLGAWRDVGWWHLRLLAGEGPPAPPRLLPEVAGSPALAEALQAGRAFLPS